MNAGPELATRQADGLGNLADLIACPACDALYRARAPGLHERAICARCHAVLIAPRRRAGLHIVALSLAVLVLIVAATVFPFLTISVGGLSNRASILDTALAFSVGPLVLVSLCVAALIIFIPIVRSLLVIYVLVPVMLDRRPAPKATDAFRLSEALRPWSMAEIFCIGCAVALVKVAGLATVGFGPAFWMFAALVVLAVLQDSFMCKWSVWNSLDTSNRF